MKTKQELIEIMARAICITEGKNPYAPSHTTVINEICYEWGWYSPQAESALKALCGALPDLSPNIPKELLKGFVPMENRLPDMYYNQLLEYGKDEIDVVETI